MPKGIGSDVTAKLSKVREQQLGIRLQLESERTRVAADSTAAPLCRPRNRALRSRKALYQLKKSQLDALHVRAGN